MRKLEGGPELDGFMSVQVKNCIYGLIENKNHHGYKGFGRFMRYSNFSNDHASSEELDNFPDFCWHPAMVNYKDLQVIVGGGMHAK